MWQVLYAEIGPNYIAAAILNCSGNSDSSIHSFVPEWEGTNSEMEIETRRALSSHLTCWWFYCHCR